VAVSKARTLSFSSGTSAYIMGLMTFSSLHRSSMDLFLSSPQTLSYLSQNLLSPILSLALI
jgi:hypothetical protein